MADTALNTRWYKHSDIIVAAAIIAMLGVMIVPLPTPLLDLLLTFNITFSALVLLTTMYAAKPLDFSVFPSLLLVATLFRLSLNVASTRLILLHAYAGQVINAFGNFVVGGNYVVDSCRNPICCDHPRCNTHSRGCGQIHPRCNARKADEHRCRSQCRSYR